MQALNMVRQRTGLRFRYVICGKAIDVAYVERIKQEVASTPDCFLYLGEISRADLRRLYSRSRLMVLGAQEERNKIEGYGLVINEAGAQQCPSIATRVGGISDAIIDGQTGLLCDPRDAQTFSDSIERLLVDQGLYEKLALGAHEYAERLTWERTAHATIAEL